MRGDKRPRNLCPLIRQALTRPKLMGANGQLKGGNPSKVHGGEVEKEKKRKERVIKSIQNPG